MKRNSPTQPAQPVPIRVLIVDDHPMVRTMVRLACEARPGLEVVGEAGDGRQALEGMRRLRPDVVVLDLLLPHLSGLEVAEAAAREELPSRILVLTGTEDRNTLFRALRLGVHGYIEKTASVEEIGAAIEGVAGGTKVFGVEVEKKAHAALGEFARRAREAAKAMATLTPREQEVLALIAEGLSSRQIATRLQVSVRTVETHLSNIYKKLEVGTRVQALYRAAGLGLVELSPNPPRLRDEGDSA